MLRGFANLRQDLLRIRLFGNDRVVVAGPAMAHEVLVRQASAFHKTPVVRSALHPLAGEGLFTSEGELWRTQRKLMAPLFQPRALRGYTVDMARCADRCVDGWRDGDSLDLARETMSIAMAVAGKTLFGADVFGEADDLGRALTTALSWVNERALSPLNNLQVQARTFVMRLAHRASGAGLASLSRRLHRTSEAMIPPLILPGRDARSLRSAIDVLDERVDQMIADRRSAPHASPDLLSRLLEARDDTDGRTMTDKQVRDEILTLFVAGHETTASALAWSVYLLLRNPAAYRRAQAEADAVTGSSIGYDDLPSLGYCLRVFKEALRMYPPLYVFGRQSTTPVQLGGYEFPRGTVVVVSPYTMHYRADVWPEPDRFDPDRFLPDAEKQRPRGAYLPLSAGPRTCIGNFFALMEGPIVLASLLRRVTFELATDRPVAATALATLRPEGGLPVRVKLRAA